ncbi:hypothetical protein ACJX0J_005973, partial [Zea mays]
MHAAVNPFQLMQILLACTVQINCRIYNTNDNGKHALQTHDKEMSISGETWIAAQLDMSISGETWIAAQLVTEKNMEFALNIGDVTLNEKDSCLLPLGHFFIFFLYFEKKLNPSSFIFCITIKSIAHVAFLLTHMHKTFEEELKW